MQKHVWFWLGAISALIIGVSVAIAAWSVATERALSLVAMAFGGMLALTLLLFLGFALRKFVLKRFLGVAEATITEVSNGAIEVFDAVVSGDRSRAKKSATELASFVIGWWTWNNFYRWVIGTNVALLIAFGGFAGTVLLFEQNKRLREQTNELIEQRKQLQTQNERFAFQNELISVTMVSELRERLRNTDRIVASADLNWFYELPKLVQGCELTFSDNELREETNPSSVAAISKLADSQLIGDKIVSALEILLEDKDHTVRLGALITLDKVGRVPENLSISFAEVNLSFLQLTSTISIEFIGSVVKNFDCTSCQVSSIGSLVIIRNALNVSSAWNSIIDTTGRQAPAPVLPRAIDKVEPIQLQGSGDSLLTGKFIAYDREFGDTSFTQLNGEIVDYGGYGEITGRVPFCTEIEPFFDGGLFKLTSQ